MPIIGKKAIGITGMPGAGKSLACQVAKELNIPIISMGDIVREEAEKRGLPPTFDVLGGIALSLREEGEDAVAKRCLDKIRKMEGNIFLIDGLRNIAEVKEFKKYFEKFMVVSIHASPKTRFERLVKRNRSDDPNTWKQFERRDLREINMGIGGVIALSDYIVCNEGTPEETKSKIRKIFKEIFYDF
ncbi:MAG: AAA family ATPase [Candidatus Odinarchaeia archaeon]